MFSKFATSIDIDDEQEEQTALKNMEQDGLENLAGYICHKLRDQVPDIAIPRKSNNVESLTWVNHLSEGGLSKPTENMMPDMQALHAIFTKLGDSLLISKKILALHMEKAAAIDCSHKVKKLFFRSRMYFRIRKLNKEIVDLASQKKRK